jgi:hypothetical protein
MNAERTVEASTPRKGTEVPKTSSRSNTTSRLTNGTRVLVLIIAGLCALRERFASVPLRDSKVKSPSSSTALPKTAFAVSGQTLQGTPALRLPVPSHPRGRRVAL